MLGPMWWLLLLGCKPDPVADLFVVDRPALGAPLAVGSGYALDTPQAAFFAAQHSATNLDGRWSFPASNIPLLLWQDLLQGQNIADDGSCPYTVVEGDALVWKTGCRSQDGYDWSGEVRTQDIPTDLGEWEVWEFELEVSSEEEGRSFDRVALTGSFWYLDGDDAPLSRFAEANWVAEVEGWWAHNFEDELEQAWHHLALTGAWQITQREGVNTTAAQALVDLGDYGGFGVQIAELSESAGCPGEPAGEIALSGQQDAVLRFEGASRCDGCAVYLLDGERQGNACRGY